MRLDTIEYLYDNSIYEIAKELYDNLNDLKEMRKMYRRLDRKKKRLVKREWLTNDIKEAQKLYDEFVRDIIKEKFGDDD